jgi:hypothetical protein
MPSYKMPSYETKKRISEKEIKEIMEKIASGNIDKIGGISSFKGSFYEIDISYLEQEQKKKLLERLNKYAVENNLNLVLRVGGGNLYIGKSYAREIAFLKPSKEEVQEIINKEIENGNLTGKGIEIYANPNIGIMVKIKDGEVQKIVPVSGASINIEIEPGIYTLNSLEHGGWSLTEEAKKNFAEFIKKYPESFKNGNPLPPSMFNLMGTAKISFKGTKKIHFRLMIYPGTLHELPLGSEAGIVDDRYDQTTAGCLYIGEGKFYALKKNGNYVTGRDTNIRKKDIGLLLKNGELEREELELGTQIKMRNGKYATLSLDRHGNQVWLDENGVYVPFNRYNFDFDDLTMPQIVFMPPEYGKSEIVNKEIEGKRLYIDNKLYYISNISKNEDEKTLSIIIFPDRHNMLNNQQKREIEKRINEELKEKGYKIADEYKEQIQEVITLAQIMPVKIDINLGGSDKKDQINAER